ncbi:MAG TPA: hypothetical protein PLK76_01315 [bacterium]|nr:hypothetical protein [bacterium]
MCGIFGITIHQGCNISNKKIRQLTDELFKLSESRGKEASGIALMSDKIYVYKKPIKARKLLKEKKYKQLFTLKNINCLIGHTRLATNGLDLADNTNNQPVVKDSLVGVHNGIVTNVDLLWQKFGELNRMYEVDTEIVLFLLKKYLITGDNLETAIDKVFLEVEGTISTAILFDSLPYLLLTTNTGSIYICFDKSRKIMVFASEKYILEQIIKKNSFLVRETLEQIKPYEKRIINLDLQNKKDIIFRGELEISGQPFNNKKISPDFSLLKYDLNEHLKRCSKCILPESFPGIEFDGEGVCNFCRDYKKNSVLPEELMKQELEKKVVIGRQPNCLIAFSGGRDSSFALHYVKNILKLNPVVFSYDWGMVTDLARRNQAKLCAKLGVEQIIISADIKKKRENIRKNVLAWLKKPDLGVVPLFMAGDKQYFYHAYKLKKQMNLDLLILGENHLEKTNFKTLFASVKPGKEKGLFYGLNFFNQLKMIGHYLKQYMINPSYLNTSLIDTIGAYISCYIFPHDYLNLFNYVKWNEKEINQILKNEYNWELAPDTNSTWRIGDGTAPFYNYIYYTMAGFTENDTFRSNQIREGLITRAEALELVKEENKPRPNGLQWYCETVGLDFNETIKTINNAPKTY